MDIYFKAEKKIVLYEKRTIRLKDIAEVFAPKDEMNKILNTEIFNIEKDGNRNYVISNLEIIEKLKQKFPSATINSVGEMDTLVAYMPNKKTENKTLTLVKIVFVTLILLAGSSTAIMTFHTDSQIATVFKNFYYIFFKEIPHNPILIDIPYSIGISLGIIVFFNHFGRKKLTKDPTPIEVEMDLYDQDITNTLIEKISVLKKKVKGK